MDKKVICTKLWLLLLVTGQISEIYCLAHTEQSQMDRKFRFKSACSQTFPVEVDTCLDPFLARITLLFQGPSKTSRFFYNIFHDYYCLKYESMLMCLHQALAVCRTPGTMRSVQVRLSAPWVPIINIVCGINVANSIQALNQSKVKPVYNTETTEHVQENQPFPQGSAQIKTDLKESQSSQTFSHKQVDHLKQDFTSVVGESSPSHPSVDYKIQDSVNKQQNSYHSIKYVPMVLYQRLLQDKLVTNTGDDVVTDVQPNRWQSQGRNIVTFEQDMSVDSRNSENVLSEDAQRFAKVLFQFSNNPVKQNSASEPKAGKHFYQKDHVQ